jgi:hypothetical protein
MRPSVRACYLSMASPISRRARQRLTGPLRWRTERRRSLRMDRPRPWWDYDRQSEMSPEVRIRSMTPLPPARRGDDGHLQVFLLDISVITTTRRTITNTPITGKTQPAPPNPEPASVAHHGRLPRLTFPPARGTLRSGGALVPSRTPTGEAACTSKRTCMSTRPFSNVS